MIYYLWVFILSGIALISIFYFLLTLNRDLSLAKQIKKKSKVLVVNFILLLISIVSTGLIIYLFLELKRQIDILT